MRQVLLTAILLLIPLTDGLTGHAADASSSASNSVSVWQAGVSRIVITPPEFMWMSGYGGRTHAAEGKVHDLYARATAIRDSRGETVVFVATDLVGVPRTMATTVSAAAEKKHGLPRRSLMIACSHTHCGPAVDDRLSYMLDMKEADWKQVREYQVWLNQRVTEAVDAAIADLKPAQLSTGSGVCRFAANRRTPKGIGPYDHQVPVLKIESLDGSKLRGVVFGYACHNTNLSFYQWSGDYAGFAQYALEDVHPDAVAMFYMGCGADQNPIPRRTVELAKGYGLRLAAAVERVLAEPMQEFAPTLQTEHEFVTLNLGKEPTRDELATIAAAGSSYVNRWAARLLKDVENGVPLERTYPYPLQAWELGKKQQWITMGGEVVVDYALGFKKKYGDDVWVASYCNDVMAYIPSLRVLDEDVPPRKSARWGYEGNRSMMVYGRAAERWADDVEELVADTVDRLMARLKQRQPEPVLN